MKFKGLQKKSTAVVLTLVMIFALAPVASASGTYAGKPAKYVFLFIGDGMGAPQRAAAEFYKAAPLVVLILFRRNRAED